MKFPRFGPHNSPLAEGYAGETSLSHMTTVATEARSKETVEWIRTHVRPERRYRPSPGRGLWRPPLRRARRTLAGRYYQLLSGHAATGTYRKRFGRSGTSECWWCTSGEPQSRHHLFTRFRAWTEQRRRLWKDVAEACEWEKPRAPSVRPPGCQGSGGAAGVPEDHEGWLHRNGGGAPRGCGRGCRRRGPGPP